MQEKLYILIHALLFKFEWRGGGAPEGRGLVQIIFLYIVSSNRKLEMFDM